MSKPLEFYQLDRPPFEDGVRDAAAVGTRPLRAALEHARRFIETETAVVCVKGAPGVGKTYLGCAFGQLACRLGFRVLYRRVPRLFEELALAHADGSYTRLLARFAKADVLVLDDWGLAPLTDQQRHDVLEILEDRLGAGSTVVTSQLPVETWHDYIAHPTVADAVLDRLVHNAHKLTMKGPSRRKETAPNH